MGQIREALEAYEEAITLNSSDGYNFWNRAKVFAQLQQFNMAIEDYIQAINYLKSESSQVLYQLYFEKGKCYLQNKEFQNAIIDLSKTLEYDKDNHECINTLGLALFESQKYELALQRFQKAIELSDKNASYHNNKALTLYNLKEYN